MSDLNGNFIQNVSEKRLATEKRVPVNLKKEQLLSVKRQ